MKPREFVGRVIDLFEFDLTPLNAHARPQSFFSVMTAMGMAVKRGKHDDHRRLLDGYLFILEAQDALGHSIIRATMVPADGIDEEVGLGFERGIRASVCFTMLGGAEAIDIMNPTTEDDLYEGYQLPNRYREHGEELIGMIGYLTLKTSCKVKTKFKK